jgi:hypothetical protein
MFRKTKFIFLTLLFVGGCARIAQEFDTTWIDNKTVYRKSHPLPPLEIPAALAKERNSR